MSMWRLLMVAMTLMRIAGDMDGRGCGRARLHKQGLTPTGQRHWDVSNLQFSVVFRATV